MQYKYILNNSNTKKTHSYIHSPPTKNLTTGKMRNGKITKTKSFIFSSVG